MTSIRAHTAFGSAVAAVALCLGDTGAKAAQDLPSDAQMQAAFGTVYNHLGLMEYCASRGFANATDVTNARKSAATVIRAWTPVRRRARRSRSARVAPSSGVSWSG